MKQNRYQFSESLDLDEIHSECTSKSAESDEKSFVSKFKFGGFETAIIPRHPG